MSRIASSGDVFRALADGNRRRMLAFLAGGDRGVTELVACFTITQPSVSEHLRVLRHVGLVRVRRLGRQRVYSLNASRLREVGDWIATIERACDRKSADSANQPDRIANGAMAIDLCGSVRAT